MSVGKSGEDTSRPLTYRMFIGEYHHTLDDKGRLAVPVKFRAELAQGTVITRGLDKTLFLYTANEWAKLADRLVALPFSQANARAFARLMLAGATEAVPDKQGRVMIPEHLRTYASLKKAVVVAGLYNRVEIWDAAAWDAYRQKTEDTGNDIAEQLGALGI